MATPGDNLEFPELLNSKDAYPDLIFRRELKNIAEMKADFYSEGMRSAMRYSELTDRDILLDVGCSSGEFMLRAAQEVGAPAYLFGLDVIDYSRADYLRANFDDSRFTFIHGSGEDIPLPDGSVKVLTAHNILFRSENPEHMLEGFKRVVEPSGLIVISTNARDHLPLRYTIERLAAMQVSMSLGISLELLTPPAEGFYLEDVPKILDRIGGLEIVEKPDPSDKSRNNPQISYVKIYEGARLETLKSSIQFSANYTDLPPEEYREFRLAANNIINAMTSYVFERQRQRHAGASQSFRPYLIDYVHRGMYVLRNY